MRAAMRTVILGGGPGGLYFAISLKLRNPAHEVVVIERNRPDDTFGWGVVLSEDTLGNLDANDPVSAKAIRSSFVYWDDIAVHYRGAVMRSGGHGFCGIGRMRLLNILQERARSLGVDLRFETEAQNLEAYKDYDLIVGADGVNSQRPRRLRRGVQARHRRARLQVSSGSAPARNSTRPSPSSSRKPSTAGSGRTPISSTPIPRPSSSNVPEETWRKSGFDTMQGDEALRACEKIFAAYSNGNALMSNARHLRGSAWLNFNRVLCERWSHRQRRAAGRRRGHRAFLDRLRHQAGAGKRRGAGRLSSIASRPRRAPSQRYEDERRTEGAEAAERRRATPLEWFEEVERYLAPRPGAVQLFAADPLAAHQPREPARRAIREWLGARRGVVPAPGAGKRRRPRRPPMFAPLQAAREWSLKNRVVVSPMAQYKRRRRRARPTGISLHYAERAKGGAGLVYHRDDLRLAGRPHHAGLHRPL